ncbi:Hypothetical protein CINCED_3A001203, partial [Cinara cedri]
MAWSMSQIISSDSFVTTRRRCGSYIILYVRRLLRVTGLLAPDAHDLTVSLLRAIRLRLPDTRVRIPQVKINIRYPTVKPRRRCGSRVIVEQVCGRGVARSFVLKSTQNNNRVQYSSEDATQNNDWSAFR